MGRLNSQNNLTNKKRYLRFLALLRLALPIRIRLGILDRVASAFVVNANLYLLRLAQSNIAFLLDNERITRLASISTDYTGHVESVHTLWRRQTGQTEQCRRNVDIERDFFARWRRRVGLLFWWSPIFCSLA